jgi:hypothetical protein
LTALFSDGVGTPVPHVLLLSLVLTNFYYSPAISSHTTSLRRQSQDLMADFL